MMPGGNDRLLPESEVAERPDDLRFLGCSGLVVLAASLSESDVVDGVRSRIEVP
jgi:hypothetical protein